MKTKLAIFLAAAALSMAAHGKTPQGKSKPMAEPKAWTLEPTTFIGFALGQPLPDTIPQCPQRYGNDDMVAIATAPTCYMHTYGSIAQIWRAPDLGFGYENSIFLQQGNVSDIWLKFDADRFAQARSLLFDKYGPPTATEHLAVKTKAGAEFDSEEDTWIGKKVTIRLRQRFDTIDQSLISASDNDLMAAQARQMKAKQQDAASNL